MKYYLNKNERKMYEIYNDSSHLFSEDFLYCGEDLLESFVVAETYYESIGFRHVDAGKIEVVYDYDFFSKSKEYFIYETIEKYMKIKANQFTFLIVGIIILNGIAIMSSTIIRRLLDLSSVWLTGIYLVASIFTVFFAFTFYIYMNQSILKHLLNDKLIENKNDTEVEK